MVERTLHTSFPFLLSSLMRIVQSESCANGVSCDVIVDARQVPCLPSRVCCSVLQCVAVCCSVLQTGALSTIPSLLIPLQ